MRLESVPVKNVMIPDVKTATHDSTLQHACMVMASHKVGCVIVVGSEGETPKIPMGIVTDTDAVRHIAKDGRSVSYRLQQLMSRPIITISSGTSLRDALRTLALKNIRRLPVVDNGELVGIVTDRDIYREIVKDEDMVASFVSEELFMGHVKELDRPWVYKMGEILHRRVEG